MAEILVVFPGIHQTLSAEAMLRERGEIVDLVPTPVAITLGCGFAVRAQAAEGGGLPSWWGELDGPRVAYRIVRKEGQKSYEEIGRCERKSVPPAGDHEPQGDGGGRAR